MKDANHVAFVAGATGYTGQEVVRALTTRGVTTVAHVRPDSSRLEVWRERFEGLGAQVDTTAWEEAAMAETVRRVAATIVFGLLGTTKKRARAEARAGGEASSYESVDYGLTALLRRACEAQEVKPRFVYLSSAGMRDAAAGSYLGVRWKLEQELIAGSLPYTIARPSFITGPDREDNRPGERYGAAVADAALGLVGLLGGRKVRDRYRATDAATLAGALVRLSLDAAAANTVVESEGLRG